MDCVHLLCLGTVFECATSARHAWFYSRKISLTFVSSVRSKQLQHLQPSQVHLPARNQIHNGQNFCFHGYLAIKDHQLRSELKRLEQQIASGQTQIFIETPYRNDRMLKMLIRSMNANIKLCIARDITGDNELIQTKPLKLWARNSSFQIGKHPCIFLLGK